MWRDMIVTRAMGQVTNSQQVIHLTCLHRVCTLRLFRLHERWVRYVRPFVQDFFMQGNSRNGIMGVEARLIYLNDRLLVKDSFKRWHNNVTRLLCWVRQGWNLKNMTDSTWIFCLRNAFACLECNHPRKGWGCQEKKKKSCPYLLEKNIGSTDDHIGLGGAAKTCANIRHSQSWEEKQNEERALSSNPEGCKHGKRKKKICEWSSLYKPKRWATAAELDLWCCLSWHQTSKQPSPVAVYTSGKYLAYRLSILINWWYFRVNCNQIYTRFSENGNIPFENSAGWDPELVRCWNYATSPQYQDSLVAGDFESIVPMKNDSSVSWTVCLAGNINREQEIQILFSTSTVVKREYCQTNEE